MARLRRLPDDAESRTLALSFVVFIDFTIVNTILPGIQRELHASIDELQWVKNAFFLMLTVFMVTMGRLGEVNGRFCCTVAIRWQSGNGKFCPTAEIQSQLSSGGNWLHPRHSQLVRSTVC